MERKISTPVYLLAFFLSLVIFLIGIYVGYLIDSANLQSISGEVSNVSDRVASIQLILLSESNSSSFCPVYLSELDALDSQIEKIGYKLAFLEDERNIFDDELKKKYFVLEAESYLLSKKMNTVCNSNLTLLVNFYSNKNCGQICKDQGAAVLQARDDLVHQMNVKLFSFDGELDSPVAEAFEVQYNVTLYPTLVINEKTYSGYQSSDQIKQIIKASK
ncbi:Uncharacterised protein [Candidatus Bilamarchaeum dharawalense]|uniref:Thioredoxin n=1 Tax=Candidatus Bilamarchaeum dharawalense TaxID=2885759 RepID=A0A5E4LXB4_9ARCH|nr:Uncharacterised protein [Candidatus Bilamarchaeum dharawalense]